LTRSTSSPILRASFGCLPWRKAAKRIISDTESEVTTTVAEVKLGDNETMESALRRFKRKVQTEDIIREVKRHAFFIPPGEKARLKSQLARKRNRKKVRRVFE
jgi:small subunit ribosomal protein S21